MTIVSDPWYYRFIEVGPSLFGAAGLFYKEGKMGLWDWLTGLAALKILFRGTDTYYRKEREAEKREKKRLAWDTAYAENAVRNDFLKRKDQAEFCLSIYKRLKKARPYDDDQQLRAVTFVAAGFTDEEAIEIIRSDGIGTPVAGRAQGPLPGRPVASMADETMWEET